MSILFYVLMMGLSIVSFVYFIIVLVKIFKKSVGLGILGIIIPVFTYIYGWIASNELGSKKTMMTWTIVIVMTIIFQIIYFSMFAATSMEMYSSSLKF